MSFYSKALPVILKHEGGLVDNKADPGGITNLGISLRWLTQAGIDVDGDGDIDADDIRALTPDKAAILYYSGFWLPAKCEECADETVATKLFDMAVNMGIPRAHRLFQQAANKCGASLTVDGNLGSKSFTAINTLDSKEFVDAVCKEQSDFYIDLATRKPALAVFLKGWLRRASWPNEV